MIDKFLKVLEGKGNVMLRTDCFKFR